MPMITYMGMNGIDLTIEQFLSATLIGTILGVIIIYVTCHKYL